MKNFSNAGAFFKNTGQKLCRWTKDTFNVDRGRIYVFSGAYGAASGGAAYCATQNVGVALIVSAAFAACGAVVAMIDNHNDRKWSQRSRSSRLPRPPEMRC